MKQPHNIIEKTSCHFSITTVKNADQICTRKTAKYDPNQSEM